MLIKEISGQLPCYSHRLSIPTSGRSPSYKRIESAEARLLADFP